MEQEIFLNLKVVTNSKEFKVTGFDPHTKTLKVKVKAKPQKGQANREIEQKLSEFFSSDTKIVFGHKSNNKKIQVQSGKKALGKKKNL